MSYDPYASPGYHPPAPNNPRPGVRAAATGLIVVAVISITVTLSGMLFDVYLLTSGTARRMRQPENFSKESQVTTRLIWSGFICGTDVITLAGAICMFSQRNLTLAKTGAILAVIPCLGPCCVLGIPFGVWALVALHQPGVREQFH